MKTYILITGMLVALLAFVALTHTTLAAGMGGKCPSLAGLAKIGDAVGATDAQKAQITTIVNGAVAETAAVESNTTLSADAQAKQLGEIRRNAHQAVFDVLTPDQKTAIMNKMAAKFAEKLGLTPDQQDKIKAVKDAEMAKIAEVRSDTALTSDERRASMKKLHEDFSAQLALILTPDQQTKLADMRAQRDSLCGSGSHPK